MNKTRRLIQTVVALFFFALLWTKAGPSVADDDFPPGTVIFMLSSTCPDGYSVPTSLTGRFILSTPQGGTAGFTSGSGLQDKESPSHSHSLTEERRYNGGSRTASNATSTGSDDGSWLPMIYLTACEKQQ